MNQPVETVQTVESAWSSIRGILREYSFSTIKDVVGAAGLPVERLAHLRQESSGGSSKGQLMDGIDGLVVEMTPDRRSRFVIGCIEEMLLLVPNKQGAIERALSRLGFGISGTTVYPLVLQLDIGLQDMPENVRENIAKALRRYRDGDFAGAITGICGGVDKLTESLFAKHGLGDHKSAPFQERVSKAFRTLENEYKNSLVQAEIPENEVKLVWENHRAAISNAAYVLGAFRRKYSDAHGEQFAPAPFVQKALDCGGFIIRSFITDSISAVS